MGWVRSCVNSRRLGVRYYYKLAGLLQKVEEWRTYPSKSEIYTVCKAKVVSSLGAFTKAFLIVDSPRGLTFNVQNAFWSCRCESYYVYYSMYMYIHITRMMGARCSFTFRFGDKVLEIIVSVCLLE